MRKEAKTVLGDCHVHMVLDGVYYKDAIGRHRDGADKAWVRDMLAAYRDAGITFLRDGGDRFGACTLARELAPEYGIEYRSPLFPIHHSGHYGGFIGRGFDDWKGCRELVRQVQRGGGDFVKFMISGLMDFDRFGVITGEPLPAGEIRDMVSMAHDEGLAVMVHANGAETVRSALLAGVDSIEHGAYMDDECLRLLAQSDAVWVPTAVTIGNLRGTGRYDEPAVEQILEAQLRNVAAAHRYGAKIALGSDAGAWHVFHGQGAADEYQLLRQALGADTDTVLEQGEEWIRRRFQPK